MMLGIGWCGFGLSQHEPLKLYVAQSKQTKLPELYFCGGPESPIKLEIFSDFACPQCRTLYYEMIKPIINEYTNNKKVYVQYHDYPSDRHAYARLATRLALAARFLGLEQWRKLTDIIYSTQDQWTRDGKFDQLLLRALNAAEMMSVKKLAFDPKIEAVLLQELIYGDSRGITSTPTYFMITQTGRRQRFTQIIPYFILKEYLDREATLEAFRIGW